MNLDKAISLASMVVTLFTVIRLYRIRVAFQFPALYALLAIELSQSLFPLFRSPATQLYAAVYVITQPVTWIIQIFVVRELYTRVFRPYPGITTCVKWSIYSAACVSLLFTIVVTSFTYDHVALTNILGSVVLLEGCLMSILGIFILGMFFLLRRFPIALEQNVATHLIVFTLWLVSEAFLYKLRDRSVDFRYYGTVATYLICVLSWGLLLRTPSSHHQIKFRNVNSQEQSRLLAQFAALNSFLQHKTGVLNPPFEEDVTHATTVVATIDFERYVAIFSRLQTLGDFTALDEFPSIRHRYLRHRRQFVRRYLADLKRDFHALAWAGQVILTNTSEDNPRLARALVISTIRFELAYCLVYARSFTPLARPNPAMLTNLVTSIVPIRANLATANSNMRP